MFIIFAALYFLEFIILGSLIIALGILILCAVFAPFIAPHDPIQIDVMSNLMPPAWHDGGSTEYLLGTDKLGRDILSRMNPLPPHPIRVFQYPCRKR